MNFKDNIDSLHFFLFNETKLFFIKETEKPTQISTMFKVLNNEKKTKLEFTLTRLFSLADFRYKISCKSYYFIIILFHFKFVLGAKKIWKSKTRQPKMKGLILAICFTLLGNVKIMYI